MKTTSIQILLAIMLLLAGCAKDELINATNEELHLKKGVSTQAVSFTFNGFPTGSDFYNVCWMYPPEEIDHPDWYLLKNGNFVGKLGSYGDIITNKSTYQFVDGECEAIKNIRTPTAYYDYNYSYKLTIKGIIYAGTKGYHCNILIEIVLEMAFPQPSSGYIIVGLRGNATFSSGTGKLAELDGKQVNVYNYSNSGRNLTLEERSPSNLNTGAVYLKVTTSNW